MGRLGAKSGWISGRLSTLRGFGANLGSISGRSGGSTWGRLGVYLGPICGRLGVDSGGVDVGVEIGSTLGRVAHVPVVSPQADMPVPHTKFGGQCRPEVDPPGGPTLATFDCRWPKRGQILNRYGQIRRIRSILPQFRQSATEVDRIRSNVGAKFGPSFQPNLGQTSADFGRFSAELAQAWPALAEIGGRGWSTWGPHSAEVARLS